MNSVLVGFRATDEQRRKIELLAVGHGCSMSEALRRIVENAEVEPVTNQVTGFQLSKNGNSRNTVTLASERATAVSA